MSGAGVTVTAPSASAADALSVDGTQPGAVVAARLAGATKPSATGGEEGSCDARLENSDAEWQAREHTRDRGR